MAKVSRMRAASSSRSAKRYGSINRPPSSSDHNDVFESSIKSIDTIRSQEIDTDFSCAECCSSTPGCVFNYTLGSCLSCLRRRRGDVPVPSSPLEDVDIRIMKERLKFHFKNPFEKWKHSPRRRFPWKLVVQMASIILVTAQLVLFANTKFALTDFLQANERTFAKLFVVDPADPDFANPVPSPISTIYTNDALLEQLTHTAKQYFYIEEVAVGPYGYQWNFTEPPHKTPFEPHLHLVVRRHTHGSVNPTTKTYEVSNNITEDFYLIMNCSDPITNAVDWAELREQVPIILDIKLIFTLSSVYISDRAAKCFQFNITLTITNDLEDGNMPVELTEETKMSSCNNESNSSGIVDVDVGAISDTKTTIVDALVLVVSLMSVLLCGRSLLYSLHFSTEVRRFFVIKFEWQLKLKHFYPLFNLWFVGILVSNVMVIVGTIMKLVIAHTDPDSLELVDITSIILGLAVFGQWCGLLRFLSYFDKYNMLLITLRLAMPAVIRFGVCTMILYISFLLCGWLVLGPYHPKFRDPSTTSECLFSLLNGDDMFATYLEMSKASTSAYIFSKIYLYTFISLFIYVVLSVFISLISDTYETLHDHWRERTRGLLQDFATDQLTRGRFRTGSHHSHHSLVEEDAADYDLMRDIAVASSEHQSLQGDDDNVPTQPEPVQDSTGHLKVPKDWSHPT